MSKDAEEVKKKLQELEEALNVLSCKTFSCVTAMLEILSEHGIVKPEEFKRHVEKHKLRHSQLMQDAEFWKLIHQLKTKPPKKDGKE